MRVVKWVSLVGVALLVIGGAAWWQREPLRIWWVVRGLDQAGNDREVWVRRAVEVGEPIIGPLVNSAVENLSAASAQVDALDALAQAGHASAVVDHLIKPIVLIDGWPRSHLLARMMKWDDESRAHCARLIAGADWHQVGQVEHVIDLALTLPGEHGRELAKVGLRSDHAETRLKAIRLCLRPGIDLLEQVVGLLRDPSPEVRRAAILAVGPAEQVVREDTLLPGLHDEDEEVRRHTESALRARGLRPEHMELGRLLTHPRPASRLQVLDRIRDMLDGRQSDLDPGVWLRKLSHDQSPAVRAAALRLMSQQAVIDLGDRIDQMARNDPSPTISQLARYYQGVKR